MFKATIITTILSLGACNAPDPAPVVTISEGDTSAVSVPAGGRLDVQMSMTRDADGRGFGTRCGHMGGRGVWVGGGFVCRGVDY